MRRLRSFLVALVMMALCTPLFAQSEDAQRRHPRPGQHREQRQRDRQHYRQHRNHRSPRYDHRRQYGPRRQHYGYRNHRRLCRYETGYWVYDRYGAYFIHAGWYIARCR